MNVNRFMLVWGLLAICIGMSILPSRALAAATIDGIPCQTMEGTVFHIHAHLTLLDRGNSIAIPNDIGRPQIEGCFYWLHTHTPDGIIHIEAPMYRSFTLGEFFDVWGQKLSKQRIADISVGKDAVRIYVDGSRYDGDPRAIELTQHTDITIEVGAPFRVPQPFTAWNGQ